MGKTASILCLLVSLLKLTSAQTVRGALGSNVDEKDKDLAQARIVGGEDVSKGDFPYFVLLDVNGKPICGGTLVSPNVVLTAAHCKPGEGVVLTVTVNAYNNGVPEQDDQHKRNISYMLSHPDFNEKQYFNDLMLLQLDEAVTSIPFVKLNVVPDRPSTGEKLAVMGLGALQENGSFASWLQVTHVQAIDNNICNALYEQGGIGPILDSMMFCAGDPGGMKDSCQGDSGGPIIDSLGQQVGVTSFGVGCARKEYPGVYARVATEENWLLDQICRLTDDEYLPDLGCGQATMLPPTLRPTWKPTPWPTSWPTPPLTPDPTVHVASSDQVTGTGLLTTMAGGNGQAGNMFDIKAIHDIQITGFDLHTRQIGSVYKALVLTKPGSYIGYETNHTAWTQIQYTTVLSQGESNFTSMPPLAKPLVMFQGQRRALYITLVDSVDMLYTTGDETAAVFVSDSNIEFFQGIGNSFPFGNAYSPRIWNGVIKYEPLAPIPHL